MKKTPKVFAILTSAGSGVRFRKSAGSKESTPKQYLKLNGKPVILFPLIALQKCKEVSGIFISAAPEYFEFIHTLAVKNKITKLSALVSGGKTRFESVRNAFSQIDIVSKNDMVLIHDAARPNISPLFVSELIKKAAGFDGLVPGIRISETLKRDKNGFVSETVNRDGLWRVQTPQIFKYSVLEKSYKRAGNKEDYTDESSMVELAGFKVKLTDGNPDNIKITTPSDIQILKNII